jgi:glycosyltransferase involved in cell wall biosynthesis
MRVLFLNPVGALGGAERCLLDLAASLRSYGVRNLELGLVAGREGPMVEEARALNIHVIPLAFGDRLAAIGDSALIAPGLRSIVAFGRRAAGAFLDTATYLPRLSSAIRDFAPSIVHSNGIKMHLLAAAIPIAAPVVWHIRDFVGDRPLVSRALRACASRADSGIAISNAVAKDVRHALPRFPVSVIHDAIDTDVFSPAGMVADLDALALTAPAPAGTARVGLVATYARWKGHEVFLQAAQRVKATLPGMDVRFYIVGGPIYETAASQYQRDELERVVRELRLEKEVHFIPFQSRIEEVYRALDVVVHASTRPEPFGRTIAEAMATGKAVVASRDSGAAELFADGADAVDVPSRSPADLATAISALVADARRRSDLGTAARTAALKCFSRERLARQVLAVYRNAGCIA